MDFQIEAGEIVNNNFDSTIGKLSGHVNPAHCQAENFGSSRFEPGSAASSAKKEEKAIPQISSENDTKPSVSECYVFKSRLQEYAQRAGLTTPVYETVKEGPSHEPFFRSTVTVNNIRYDSLPGFFNRKAAEQSAAEVALIKLSKSVDTKFGIAVPVQQTGLCKNLLQEYAQKMNYAVPLYECVKNESHGKCSMYSCVAEIGGIKYIGASARTKKEAEIKAARTALLTIQSAPSTREGRNTVYTVVPQKKRGSDLKISTEESAAALKPKKGRFKKQNKRRMRLKKQGRRKVTLTGASEVNLPGQDVMESVVGDVISSQQNMADGIAVNKVITDAICSVDKAAEGSEVKTGDQAVTEQNLTNSVNLERKDPVVNPIETKPSVSNTGIGNDIVESASVPSDGLRRDGKSLTMEASVTGEAGLKETTS